MTPSSIYSEYENLRRIATGSGGTVVFRGCRHGESVPIAVKIVPAGDARDEIERVQIERHGAELQRGIAAKDKRVVRIDNILDRPGLLVIEMELISGVSLFQSISSRSLTPLQAGWIARELCLMIETLVDEKIVHCDLKPGNVMLSESRTVRVTDFGSARRVDSPIGSPSIFRTPTYCSPERLRTGYVSHTSDLWSVGVILYEMVAGVHPFAAPEPAVERRIRDGTGPNPLPPAVECPEQLKSIIHKSLAFEEHTRYLTAKDMADDLHAFVASGKGSWQGDRLPPSRDGSARLPGQPSFVPPLPKPRMVVPPANRRTSPGRVRKPKRMTIASAVCLLLLAGVLARLYPRWNEAKVLRNSLVAGRISPDDVWQEISSNPRALTIRLSGLKSAMVENLLTAGLVPIVEFRGERISARTPEWASAQDRLEIALQIDPDNNAIRGNIALCRGHRFRIRSRTLVSQKAAYDAAMQAAAIELMKSAASLMPNSYDPYIGLARIYFADMGDVEQGIQMRQEAVRRGHRPTGRERLEEADALRARATSRLAAASNPSESSGRRLSGLQGAKADFENELKIYGDLMDFNNNVPGLARTARKHLRDTNILLGSSTP